jgi:hypothetical protein
MADKYSSNDSESLADDNIRFSYVEMDADVSYDDPDSP